MQSYHRRMNITSWEKTLWYPALDIDLGMAKGCDMTSYSTAWLPLSLKLMPLLFSLTVHIRHPSVFQQQYSVCIHLHRIPQYPAEVRAL